jgi:hypothetical protein
MYGREQRGAAVWQEGVEKEQQGRRAMVGGFLAELRLD